MPPPRGTGQLPPRAVGMPHPRVAMAPSWAKPAPRHPTQGRVTASSLHGGFHGRLTDSLPWSGPDCFFCIFSKVLCVRISISLQYVIS
jgi:hypothetical protein